jgi:hypothetical protein
MELNFMLDTVYYINSLNKWAHSVNNNSNIYNNNFNVIYDRLSNIEQKLLLISNSNNQNNI